MSQQFEEMERGYQAQPLYPAGSERSYGPGPGFDDAFAGLSGQKLNVGYLKWQHSGAVWRTDCAGRDLPHHHGCQCRV